MRRPLISVLAVLIDIDFFVELGDALIFNALRDNDFDDIEGCLQAECAKAVNADYIVTRNIEDFAHSKILAILPEDLLKDLVDER